MSVWSKQPTVALMRYAAAIGIVVIGFLAAMTLPGGWRTRGPSLREEQTIQQADAYAAAHPNRCDVLAEPINRRCSSGVSLVDPYPITIQRTVAVVVACFLAIAFLTFAPPKRALGSA